MLESAFMQMALLASLATGTSLALLGVYLAIRRVVFFGLVLASAATLGAAVAEILGWPPVSLSVAAGIAAAAGLGEAGSSTRVSDESLMGWAYTAATAATVLTLSQAPGGSVDTMHLLFGNVLAIQPSHVVALLIQAAIVVSLHLLFWRRFLLVTFDAEAARVAGVKTRWWALTINLMTGGVAATAVHEIGALSTFALLTLPAMAALITTASLRATLLVATGLGLLVPPLALTASFYLDLPVGPACAGFLALSVAVAAIGRKYREIGLPFSRVTSGRIVAGLIAIGLLGLPVSARAQTPPGPLQQEILQLRKDLEALKQDYEARLSALEAKLTAAQSAAAATAPTPTAVTAAEGTVLPVYGGTAAGSKIFNPDIAAIGNFQGTAGHNEVAPSPALAMPESEVSLQAIVDPYARADFFLSFGEAGVDLEEGYATFTSLPGGLLTRVGKMRAAFGKVNMFHSHVSPWPDRPLVTENLLGGEEGVSDAGVSVARLIPNPWLFLEATGQVFRGSAEGVFHASEPGDVSYVAHLRAYQDVSESTNIELGASYSRGHNAAGIVDGIDVGRFTTGLFGIDGTVRWRPLRRSIYHSFIGRTELVWSRRQQFDGEQDAFGYFASADYQLARRWVAGVRYDRSDRAEEANLFDRGGSLVLSFQPSEFSLVRGQYRRINYGSGSTANELRFQVLFSIGAHGAHPF